MSVFGRECIGRDCCELMALDYLSLPVPVGTCVFLLGPSGCGKTTLLRRVAGLEVPSAGRILLDGADRTPVPTHKRDFGMVFQSLALFPHLNVADNIAYALRISGGAAQERRRRVEGKIGGASCRERVCQLV